MKTITLCLMFMLVSSGMWAQNQLNHEKKMFLSADGKLYNNKALPVYLRVSNSPNEDAPSHLLKSVKTPKYSNPMYLDSEGWNSVHSPSCVDTVTKKMIYPEQNIVFDIYADGTAPKTILAYDTKSVIFKKNKTITNGTLSLDFKANDLLSGVEGTYVSVDGANYQKQTKALVLDKQKTYIVKYYSVDNVGNIELAKTETFVVDNSNPVSEMEILGDKYESILSGKSIIKIKSTDTISGVAKIMYKLDEQREVVYTGPLYMSLISQGDHKIIYYGIDQVNNKEAEHVMEFYVDKTAPTILEEIAGKTFMANGKEYSSGTSKLKITTFDNKAGVKEIFYSLDGKEYKKYDQPVVLSAFSGKLDIRTYAIDNVNNRAQSNESENRKKTISSVDLNGPNLAHSFVGSVIVAKDTVYINNKTKIALSAKDGESGTNKIEYRIDDGEMVSYSTPFLLEREGTHKISFTGYDNVDNLNSSEITLVVDNSGPEIFYRFSANAINGNAYPTSVVLFLSATDVMAGYENLFYKVNANPYKPYLGEIKDFIQKGNYSVIVKSKDKLGNESDKHIDFIAK